MTFFTHWIIALFLYLSFVKVKLCRFIKRKTEKNQTADTLLSVNLIIIKLEKGGADPGEGGPGGQDPPFRGTLSLHKRGNKVARMHCILVNSYLEPPFPKFWIHFLKV